MSKGLRLDPSNSSDIKWLEKRFGKENTQSLLSKSKNQSIITSALDDLNKSGITESSQNKTRKGKYDNEKVWCSVFERWIDSINEHRYLHVLLTLQKDGHISELKSGERIKLIVNDTLICAMEMDYTFKYNGKKFYADYKNDGTITSVFKLKKKLFEAIYNEPVYLINNKKEGIITQIIDKINGQN